MEECLKISEVALLCKVAPETIKDRMRRGVYKLGVHFFRPNGARPRFKKSAVIAWMEGDEANPQVQELQPIPMKRGYVLGQGINGRQS
jgi:hypothetical protein